jgi:threonine-phosphate decarboxylase
LCSRHIGVHLMAIEHVAIEHGGNLFAVARDHGWDWREMLDFSASINPLGPSARVEPAICKALERIVHYPERDPILLRSALGREWCLEDDQILLGNGATELIFFLSRLFRAAQATLALPVFSEFHRAFPEADAADLMDSSTWARDGLLVLTRPANPTGWSLPVETLCRYLETSEASVVVDESFLEFTGLPSVATLIARYPRLMVLRSLTKFYALPGLRVGALIGSAAAVRLWQQLREPWQVNVLAEEAALAAISDTSHASRSLEFVRRERDWLVEQLRGIPKVNPLSPTANFIFVPLDYAAGPVCDHLLRSKILIRNCTAWPGLTGDAVRIAVRRREENERLLEVWRKFPCD